MLQTTEPPDDSNSVDQYDLLVSHLSAMAEKWRLPVIWIVSLILSAALVSRVALKGLPPVGALLGAACIITVGCLVRMIAVVHRETRPRQTLLVSGPYSFSQNPSYVGTIVIFIGLSVGISAYASVAISAVVVMVAVHVFTTLQEAKGLLALHGEAYVRYSAAAPKWIGRRRRPTSESEDHPIRLITARFTRRHVFPIIGLAVIVWAVVVLRVLTD